LHRILQIWPKSEIPPEFRPELELKLGTAIHLITNINCWFFTHSWWTINLQFVIIVTVTVIFTKLHLL